MDGRAYINATLERIKQISPGQTVFFQAATEILNSLQPLLDKDGKYYKHRILDRIVMPERTTMFRVTYINDKGEACPHFGYRVQFSSAIGPFKGGLRFHPSVNLDVIKFLGFEQIFRDSLTGVSMGGAKGGSNFDPKGKSEGEIMRFCQAFMLGLQNVIGDVIDVPAGDIGVGGREIGYLFGQYKKITHRFDGALTGKGLNWGGSLARTEATGYGLIYFATQMLSKNESSLDGKICTVSGAGNVAIYACEKLYQMGAKPVTVSDSTGYIYDKDGIDVELLKRLKEVERVGLINYTKERTGAKFTPVSAYGAGRNGVWDVPCDAAFPCATQNEVSLEDIKVLYNNGCRLLAEGANMPSTLEAMQLMSQKGDFLYGPAKAAHAGGVATSGLEMSQNASMTKWSFEKVDKELQGIMKHIVDISYETSVEFGRPGDLVLGGHIAGFRKVADAMIDQGY